MTVRVGWRRSLALTGTVLKFLAVPLLFPLGLAIYYNETLAPFLITIAVTLVLGLGLEQLDTGGNLGTREAFLLVALAWLSVALVGALPFIIAGVGTLAHPVNAAFEAMSGLTTTGATVLQSFDHPRSIMMWRQLIQWLGGLGILVLAVAILSRLSVGGAQLMETESRSREHTDRLTPQIADTARLIGSLYLGITTVAIVVFYGLGLLDLAPRMTLYNAIAHAFTSVGTAGFSPEPLSAGAFSPVAQYAIMLFMILGSTNFVLIYFLLRGRFARLRDSQELKFYLGSITLFAALVVIVLSFSGYSSSFEETVRHGLFNVVSIITTTGYANADFAQWTAFAQFFLFLGMFLGGMAGSTTCSIKSVRWMMIFKSFRRDLFTAVHPEAVRPVRMGGRPVDETTIRDIYGYVLLAIVGVVVSTTIVAVDGARTGTEVTAFESMGAAASTFLNIGPAFGPAGPYGTYDVFPMTTKIAMFVIMWIGRIEIFPVLVLLSPTYWRS